MSFRAGLVLFTALILPLSPATARAGDPIINYNRDDPAMKAANRTALRRLPEFLSTLSSGAGEDFHVKVPIPYGGGRREHIWMGGVTVEGEAFVGRIANDPVHLDIVRKGSPYRIAQTEISDWYYVRAGRMHGSFTTRVMLERLPPEQAAAISATLAPE